MSPQLGAVGREVFHGAREILIGLAQAHRFFLQHFQIVSVNDLSLIHPVELKICVEGNVEVDNFVYEFFDPEIMDEKLDFRDILPCSFSVVRHPVIRYTSMIIGCFSYECSGRPMQSFARASRAACRASLSGSGVRHLPGDARTTFTAVSGLVLHPE
jgi:hypothetical protein